MSVEHWERWFAWRRADTGDYEIKHVRVVRIYRRDPRGTLLALVEPATDAEPWPWAEGRAIRMDCLRRTRAEVERDLAFRALEGAAS